MPLLPVYDEKMTQLFDHRLLLLVQDDTTLLTLNAQEPPQSFKGWMQVLLTRLFVHDINTAISKHETVMHIHSSGEDFDSLAESCFVRRQVKQPVASHSSFCFRSMG